MPIIFVLIPPAIGHVNPTCTLLTEICKRKKATVFAFCDVDFEPCIRRTGAQFIPYTRPQRHIFSAILKCNNNDKRERMLQLCIRFARQTLTQLVVECVSRTPDLIVFDNFFTPAKYLSEILDTFVKKPKMVMFAPNFPITHVNSDEPWLVGKLLHIKNRVKFLLY